MYWADELADQIIKSKQHTPYWVDDMKTPSGVIHVGSLRGVLVHDLVYKALLDRGVEAKYTYVFNDMDPMDKLPHYIDQDKYAEHQGKSFFLIPAPDGKSPNYARQFAQDFIDVMNRIGARPEIVWSSELYQSGQMNEVIKEALDQVDIVRRGYKVVAGQDKPEGWYPFQVICPKCQKLGSTLVTGWDGEKVHFSCKKDLVAWAAGCGHEGEVSPFDGNGKLMWKVDWPAHWKALGITIEGAGKDHTSAGGSRDIAAYLLKHLFQYPEPFDIPYEWFLISGRKMSTSKGVGTSAQEYVAILPPELARFVFVKHHYNRQVNFDPSGDTIPDLFDDYDRAATSLWDGSDPVLARMFELSQVRQDIPERHFLPRFRDVAKYLQDPKADLKAIFAEQKGSELTDRELSVLDERIHYANIWLKDYAPRDQVFELMPQVPAAVADLNSEQRAYLDRIVAQIELATDPDELQQTLYQTAKDMGLAPRKAFQAIYVTLLGKTHGPKAAWLILEHREQVIARLRNLGQATRVKASIRRVRQRPTKLLKLDPGLCAKYPTISVGYALIEAVNIGEVSQALEAEKLESLKAMEQLTTANLNQMTEIKSYRKMYKDMGVDWHSRRPSPEALLRRVALGKDMPRVNTCVDAYNLVVMRRRLSIGAFDAQMIQFPVTVREALGGERILLLGDEEETELKPGEVSYFDEQGPYNLDFNFRDAHRTQVTTSTKNIWINAEGVYDIDPVLVEKALEEVVEMITKYCGGEVKEMGMLLASEVNKGKR